MNETFAIICFIVGKYKDPDKFGTYEELIIDAENIQDLYYDKRYSHYKYVSDLATDYMKGTLKHGEFN